MKKYILITLMLAATVAFAQVKQTVTRSSVKYQIKNMGINTDGVFGEVAADIRFDDAHLNTSSIDASIDAASINSENNMRDNHLKSNDYFDVQKYPKITMKSVSFKRKSAGNYTGVFNVTIKDKTKSIEVPFTYTEKGEAAVFKGSFKINRQDFGVGGKSLMLSNEATITIEVETNKIP
ncbi:YceI family protein [Mucilaginibacter sp. KACC 22063]|uniref:YceI family protein n=1 Tax=Mucilaginibacter sp. KACC 22063 TaxID=3025666 RepID=UPI0023659C6C|nr:YceI family protein [Mucilaginibacter sp. KACC 22063]WDF55032.1 YceI family protein [Mucilaginibacter sp. KACC 22063]